MMRDFSITIIQLEPPARPVSWHSRDIAELGPSGKG